MQYFWTNSVIHNKIKKGGVAREFCTALDLNLQLKCLSYFHHNAVMSVCTDGSLMFFPSQSVAEVAEKSQRGESSFLTLWFSNLTNHRQFFCSPPFRWFSSPSLRTTGLIHLKCNSLLQTEYRPAFTFKPSRNHHFSLFVLFCFKKSMCDCNM